MPSKAEQIRDAMKNTGVFSEKSLSYITDDLVVEMERQAESVPEGTFPANAKPASQIWSGNNFTISGGLWYWQDQPGSQCGRARWWKYQVRVGDGYVQRGTCPQGYVWYEFDIMH